MTFVKQFNTISDTVLDNLRQKADGKTLVSLFNECSRATLDAIGIVKALIYIDLCLGFKFVSFV